MAVPLPVSVIAALLGVRAEDGHRLKSWSDALAHFMNEPFQQYRNHLAVLNVT